MCFSSRGTRSLSSINQRSVHEHGTDPETFDGRCPFVEVRPTAALTALGTFSVMSDAGEGVSCLTG